MPVPILQVDAFTAEPFFGNPAAVCLLDAFPGDERWMQHVAREMNLAETAFVAPHPVEPGGSASFHLRWFTPSVEIALCGHATLASAHALWETGRLPATEIARFHTKSGLLTAARHGDWIELDFPATPADSVEAPAGLADSLGVTPVEVRRSRFDYLVVVADESTVRGAAPDFRALRTLPVRGVMITSRATAGGFDFVSRFFAPASGIDEDPVTGSAHCALTPYWAEKLGKTTMVARQVSARGGTLKVRLDGDRVKLGGQAVTVLRGTLDA
jgi:PhzF family phenazine biosynthesis protein